MLGDLNKLFVSKSLLTTPSNVLPLHLKQTFPPIIWIFTEGYLLKSFLLYHSSNINFLHIYIHTHKSENGCLRISHGDEFSRCTAIRSSRGVIDEHHLKFSHGNKFIHLVWDTAHRMYLRMQWLMTWGWIQIFHI